MVDPVPDEADMEAPAGFDGPPVVGEAAVGIAHRTTSIMIAGGRHRGIWRSLW